MLYIECCKIIVTFFNRYAHVNATDGLIPLINRFDVIPYIYIILYIQMGRYSQFWVTGPWLAASLTSKNDGKMRNDQAQSPWYQPSMVHCGDIPNEPCLKCAILIVVVDGSLFIDTWVCLKIWYL